MKPSNNMENTIPSDTYWSVQLICMNVQAHSFLEPLLEHNQDQTPLTNQKLLWLFKPTWELQKFYVVSD